MSKDMDEELEDIDKTVIRVRHIQPFNIKYEVEAKSRTDFENLCELFDPERVYKTDKRLVLFKNNVSYTYVFE